MRSVLRFTYCIIDRNDLIVYSLGMQKSEGSMNKIISPGNVIKDYIIIGLGMGVRELSRALNVPPNRIYDIIQNKREITVDTAIRLGHFLNMEPEFWLDIQTRYNVQQYLKNNESIKNEILPLTKK